MLTLTEAQTIESLAEKARAYRERLEQQIETKHQQRDRDRQAYINASRGRAKASALLVWGRRGR